MTIGPNVARRCTRRLLRRWIGWPIPILQVSGATACATSVAATCATSVFKIAHQGAVIGIEPL